jgi:uncharacterized membrane protein
MTSLAIFAGFLAVLEAVAGRTLSPRRAWSAWRDWYVWGIAAVTLAVYCVISLSRLVQLDPASWDLGIFTEYVRQLVGLHAPVVDIRDPRLNILGDHFSPIVALIAPFFRIWPSAATLLVAQAALAAVSVFPVAQVGTEKLGVRAGRAIALAYAFSWGLQEMADFDFHEVAFAVPLLAFSLSAWVRGRTMAAVWWALPLVFVKEDQGLTVAAIGLLIGVTAMRRQGPGRWEKLAGPFLIVWGLGWSFLAIAVIIPHFNPHHHYAYWHEGGVIGGSVGFSATGLVKQSLQYWWVKLQTCVRMALMTAFTALGSPVALIVLPSLVLRLVGTSPVYWGTYWHYNATAMPILFIAGIDAMARARVHAEAGSGRPWLRPLWVAAERNGAAMMVIAAAVPVFYLPVSELWVRHTYQVSSHVRAAEAAMARVPSGATVATTENLLAPLAARTDTFWIGHRWESATEYIVFDGENSGLTDIPAYIKKLYPKSGYRVIYVSDDVYVFKR